jgi:hypothetical protein
VVHLQKAATASAIQSFAAAAAAGALDLSKSVHATRVTMAAWGRRKWTGCTKRFIKYSSSIATSSVFKEKLDEFVCT